ncbi:hypothetical protein A4X13_0g5845 [Tilletia indica]|uniref:Uncharacterized protein n=1 Tax=Tilletia indica TaxID=43049 RepID=A0A8T8SR22_9BASI|nr:hypothetical protein A4X13_0g5845 [Tilletia indica]
MHGSLAHPEGGWLRRQAKFLPFSIQDLAAYTCGAGHTSTSTSKHGFTLSTVYAKTTNSHRFGQTLYEAKTSQVSNNININIVNININSTINNINSTNTSININFNNITSPHIQQHQHKEQEQKRKKNNEERTKKEQEEKKEK